MYTGDSSGEGGHEDDPDARGKKWSDNLYGVNDMTIATRDKGLKSDGKERE